MASETLTTGGLPRIQWSPVITGVLCALAAHIVLGLFGAAFGFAASPADSEGIGVAAGIWGMLVPLVASFVGAFICVRIAREQDDAGAYLHGALVWCIGLIAGALFLTSTLATSAMSSATATSGNVRGGISEGDASAPRTEARMEDVAKGAAAAAGAGGLGALLGLGGAFLGAAAGRRALSGQGMGLRRGGGRGFTDRMHRDRGHREEGDFQRGYREGLEAAQRERSGIVASTTSRPPDAARPVGDPLRPGDDPNLHH